MSWAKSLRDSESNKLCPVSLQVRCWNTWLHAVAEGQAARAVLQMAVAHWAARELRAAFVRWRLQLECSRALLQRAMAICTRLMHTHWVPKIVEGFTSCMTLHCALKCCFLHGAKELKRGKCSCLELL